MTNSRKKLMLVIPSLLGLITWLLIKMTLLSGSVLFATELLLLFSVVLLIWEGSELLVKSSQEIAEHFQVSPFLIGLTIVAFGTSVPELVTSLMAGLGGKGDIAVANIVGSNFLNISVILGGLALLTKGGLTIERQTVRLDAPILILGSILILIFLGQPPVETMMFDRLKHFGLLNMKLDFIEAVILVIVFALYLFIVIAKRKNTNGYSDQPTAGESLLSVQHTTTKNAKTDNHNPLFSKGIGLLAGLAIVLIGCHVLVGEVKLVEGVTRGYGAVWFASVFGMPDFLVGLTIIALGTSVPEIVVSLSAARSNSIEIGVGNLLGSAIFNIFAVLGLAGLFVQPPLAETITINAGALQSLIAMGLLFILVFIFLSTSKKLSRTEGFVLFCTGIAFMIYETVKTISAESV